MICSYNTSLKLKMMPAINRRVERTHNVGPRSIEKRKHIGSENRKRAGIEKKLRGIGRGRMETDIIGVNICKGSCSFLPQERTSTVYPRARHERGGGGCYDGFGGDSGCGGDG